MGSEWPIVSLGDLAADIQNALVGGPFGSNLLARDRVDAGVPVIQGANMSSGRWLGGALVFVTEAKADSLAANTARYGDIIFTQRGTVGQVSLVPDTHPRFVVSQSQMKLTPDPTIAEAHYLYYYFSAPEQLAYMKTHAIQTGVPHTNLGILRDSPVVLPPLGVQREIASMLGVLDDKIELNHRMSRTLDETARALFKSWFVAFERTDPTTELASVWPERPLDSIAFFRNGLAMQKHPPAVGLVSVPVIKISQLRSGETFGADQAGLSFPSEYLVKDGDLLFSWSGSLLADFWTSGWGALNQHLFKVEPIQGVPNWFIYFWIREHLASFQRIAAGKATTMGHIQRGHLSAAMVPFPPAELLRAADEHLAPIMKRSLACRREAHTLRRLRDALLPPLLCGELTFGDTRE